MYGRKYQSWIEINISLPWSTTMVNSADQNPKAYLTQCTS